MDFRRILLFFTISMTILLGWDLLQAQFFPQARPAIVDVPEGLAAPAGSDAPEVVVDGSEATDADAADRAVGDDLPAFPDREVTIGSLDPQSGYFLNVTLASEGAAIRRVELNDPRYRELTDRDRPLAVVGGRDGVPLQSFVIGSTNVDGELERSGERLATIHWELVDSGEDFATFRLPPVAGGPELRKAYRITKGGDREEDATGYQVQIELTATNPGETAAEFDYRWQGPISVPLENLESTRTFVELKGGAIPEGEDDVEVVSMTAGSVVEQYEEALAEGRPDNVSKWRDPLTFVGVDVQSFAALAMGATAGRPIEWLREATPLFVERAENVDHSDVSVALEAVPMQLPPGGSQTHAMQVYFGPKRSELLDQFGAGEIIAFGWFGAISRIMLAVLGFFHHSLGLPYALAIMLLTCCVRGLLMPISLKTAQQGKKMKAMQPEIAKLTEKYGDDKEGLMKAQMQLYRDHDFNMLGGCLPVLLQFPIFIGLYQALYNAIDLRLASFLWIDNLAAPDHLFRMPFSLPFLGQWFNLLPVLTCVLFIAQQKMFMPPPTSEEQEVQQKMMKVMMIGMGFIFYHVPAGLCLYFIASSLWGMTERALIDRDIIKLPERKKSAKPKKPKQTPGWMQKLLDAADEAKKESERRQSGK